MMGRGGGGQAQSPVVSYSRITPSASFPQGWWEGQAASVVQVTHTVSTPIKCQAQCPPQSTWSSQIAQLLIVYPSNIVNLLSCLLFHTNLTRQVGQVRLFYPPGEETQIQASPRR